MSCTVLLEVNTKPGVVEALKARFKEFNQNTRAGEGFINYFDAVDA